MDSDLTADEPNEAPPPLVGAPAAVGDLLDGRWSVAEIRRGGQAWVLIVDDVENGERCAIKTPMFGTLTGDAELVMLLGLEPHPHVVTTLDVIELDGKPGIVLEYVPTTLAEMMARVHGVAWPQQRGSRQIDSGVAEPKVPILPYAFADVLQQICSAMAYIYDSAGVVHLDLKPSNILIDDAGRAKVADFGISQKVELREGRYPSAGGGTWAYAAPEVLHQQQFTTTADVYSFGVILYEACTGVLPYPFQLAHESDKQRAQLLDYYAGTGPDDRVEELDVSWGRRQPDTPTNIPVPPPSVAIGYLLSACLGRHRTERPQHFHDLEVLLARSLEQPPAKATTYALPEAAEHRRELALAQALIRLGRYEEAVNRLNRLLSSPLAPDVFDKALVSAQEALISVGRHADAAALETWRTR